MCGRLKWFYKILNWVRNYTIAWIALVQLQFVLQFDEEVIAWTCNGFQKILKNYKIHCLKIIETKQNIYDYTIEKYKRKIVTFKRIIHNYKPITIEKNQKIKSLQIIENSVCVTTQQRNIKEGYVTLKIIMHGYSH